MKESYAVPVTPLRGLGTRGMYHLDINGLNRKPADWRDGGRGSFRGPFDIVPMSSGSPTYPALWQHVAERERCLVVRPDREGLVRDGCESSAIDAWNTATRLHITLDFRLNSQSLAACLTPVSTLGGRAWPNFLMTERRHEMTAALWANTTLGLILFWWFGTVQQAGRACVTISRLPDLHVLDPRALTEDQQARAKEIFDKFKARPLRRGERGVPRRDPSGARPGGTCGSARTARVSA